MGEKNLLLLSCKLIHGIRTKPSSSGINIFISSRQHAPLNEQDGQIPGHKITHSGENTILLLPLKKDTHRGFSIQSAAISPRRPPNIPVNSHLGMNPYDVKLLKPYYKRAVRMRGKL